MWIKDILNMKKCPFKLKKLSIWAIFDYSNLMNLKDTCGLRYLSNIDADISREMNKKFFGIMGGNDWR